MLADPALRTEPLDNLKYIPLSSDNAQSYVSLGANVRERFETVDSPLFGVGANNHANNYVIQRLEVHADIRPNQNWQIFIQLQDDHAFGKNPITPVDVDKLDFEQAFVTYTGPLAGGTIKVRVGRQEMAFDLQRFVSVRDGPNVRQAYDAIWVDWERQNWRYISFWSEPVQYHDMAPFDNRSNGHLQFGGFRVEDNAVGLGKLSAYYARYQLDNAVYLGATGNERRNVLDVRYVGAQSGYDWDLEAMGQDGSVGTANVLAWAIGTRSGYTFYGTQWTPRLGLQVDAASGDHHPGDGTVQTFNPLFPNGYYVTLAGFTGYVNFIHVKPSITVKPTPSVTLFGGIGLQWRESTGDAVYVQPNIPVPGTAGEGGNWTGVYGQFIVDWQITPNLASFIEADHFQIGSALRRAGGHDANYCGVQLAFGW